MSSNVYVAELVKFTPSEAYKRDSSVLSTPALDKLAKATGFKQSYRGAQVEDGIVFWVVVWETLDHHLAVVNDSQYSAFIDTIKPAFDGKPEVLHGLFSTDYTKSVTAPATEIVYIAVKDGHTVDELIPLLKILRDQVDKSQGLHNQSWGTLYEKPNVYAGILGWDTVEAHINATKHPAFADVVSKITAIADLDLKHAHLKKD